MDNPKAIFGRVADEPGNLGIAPDVSALREEEVAAVRLRLSGRCVLWILFDLERFKWAMMPPPELPRSQCSVER